MKITKLTTWCLPPHWIFLKIEADEGIVGWDESIVEDRARTMEVAIHELGDYLIGQDPAWINGLWWVVYRAGFYRGGPILVGAIADIDRALWDIKGEALNAPVWQLLGGLVRDKVRTYSQVEGDRPAEVITGINMLHGMGFDTFKLNGCQKMGVIDSLHTMDVAVNTVVQIRKVFGNDIESGLDFRGRVSAPMAKLLTGELEPYRPLLVGEPALAEQAGCYPWLAAQTAIPLAAGGRTFSRFEFERVLEAGDLVVLQSSLSHAGGITEYFKTAGMVETVNVSLVPHYPLDPIMLATCLYVDFISCNAVFQEQSMGIHYNQGVKLLDFVKNKADFSMEGGYPEPLMKPRLGVDIDEGKMIEMGRRAPDWRNPIWHLADGIAAEWWFLVNIRCNS